jgi:hypothetical protein
MMLSVPTAGAGLLSACFSSAANIGLALPKLGKSHGPAFQSE